MSEDWPMPVVYTAGPFRLERSRAGYGWNVKVGKRVRWCSTRATTPMWPGLHRGGDEHCNRAVTLMLWPLGHLDVWWEPHWHTGPGFCETCTEKCRREGFDSRCCDEHYPEYFS